MVRTEDTHGTLLHTAHHTLYTTAHCTTHAMHASARFTHTAHALHSPHHTAHTHCTLFIFMVTWRMFMVEKIGRGRGEREVGKGDR